MLGEMLEKIGIIGGGFVGTMTAVQIIKQAVFPCEIIIICNHEDLNRGIAYSPYSHQHILNVTTGKMSAFPDQPDHFLEFVMKQEEFREMDSTLISNAFLSRRLYGDYLWAVYQEALIEAKTKHIGVTWIHDTVNELIKKDLKIQLSFEKEPSCEVDICVIATGNQVPKNPSIPNVNFFESKNYFQNPWKLNSVVNLHNDLPVLIIGNGLTMVDTILGLQEQNFKGEIYSISPNGFNILPHRHGGMKYTAHIDEINVGMPLAGIVSVLNKHIKIVRTFGVSAEPIIDALRPMSQKIWRHLSTAEKNIFISRLRHLFGVARHRIPLHIHDKIQKLRIDGILHIHSGRLIDIIENDQHIEVTYYDKKLKTTKFIKVARVINCTGPESDLSKLKNSFLSECIKQGLLQQDDLKLGLKTNIDTYRVYDQHNIEHQNIYTLGSNLRGELWETTAVNELRTQAKALAEVIVSAQSALPES